MSDGEKAIVPEPPPLNGAIEHLMLATHMHADNWPVLLQHVIAAAKAEARQVALAEAAQIAKNPYSDAVQCYGYDEPLMVGHRIAEAIRARARVPEVPE